MVSPWALLHMITPVPVMRTVRYMGSMNHYLTEKNITKHRPYAWSWRCIHCSLQWLTCDLHFICCFVAECADGWFGFNCYIQCYCASTSEICAKDNGFCRSGCKPGHMGSGCQIRECGYFRCPLCLWWLFGWLKLLLFSDLHNELNCFKYNRFSPKYNRIVNFLKNIMCDSAYAEAIHCNLL